MYKGGANDSTEIVQLEDKSSEDYITPSLDLYIVHIIQLQVICYLFRDAISLTTPISCSSNSCSPIQVQVVHPFRIEAFTDSPVTPSHWRMNSSLYLHSLCHLETIEPCILVLYHLYTFVSLLPNYLLSIFPIKMQAS